MKKQKMIGLLFIAFVFGNPQAKATEIASLNWLKGNWEGIHQGMPIETQYSSSRGGIIMGMMKVSQEKQLVFFEFETISEKDNTLVLQPYPFGQAGVSFEMKEISSHRVVFENLTHDFPTRIIYELSPNSELIARIEGTQNQKFIIEEFHFSKAN